MLRNQLSAAVRNAVEKLGYTFFEGFGYRMNEKNINFPAAWWCPPKIRSVRGRNEGIVVYRVELILMSANKKYDEVAKNQLWDEMEEHALKIYSDIVDEQGVFCTDNITLTPAECSLTRQSELSLKAEFDVKMSFIYV